MYLTLWNHEKCDMDLFLPPLLWYPYKIQSNQSPPACSMQYKSSCSVSLRALLQNKSGQTGIMKTKEHIKQIKHKVIYIFPAGWELFRGLQQDGSQCFSKNRKEPN